jgi:hypothetical protein
MNSSSQCRRERDRGSTRVLHYFGTCWPGGDNRTFRSTDRQYIEFAPIAAGILTDLNRKIHLETAVKKRSPGSNTRTSNFTLSRMATTKPMQEIGRSRLTK